VVNVRAAELAFVTRFRVLCKQIDFDCRANLLCLLYLISFRNESQKLTEKSFEVKMRKQRSGGEEKAASPAFCQK
jgi:hypothetical protein